MTTTTASSESDPDLDVETCQLLYIQDGVILKTITEESPYIDCAGMLSIVKYPPYKISIEWKPKDFVLIDSLQEQEWTLVNTRLTTQKNHKFPLEDIDKMTTTHKMIKLIGKENDASATFYFPRGNVDTFFRNINIHCEISKVRKNTVKIITPNKNQIADDSLASLGDFYYEKNHGYGIGSLVKNIANAPVETIWKAGAKLGIKASVDCDTVLRTAFDMLFPYYLPGIFSAEETDERTSLHSVDSDHVEVTSWCSDELELGPRPEILRGIPLLENQWNMFVDENGCIKDVKLVKDIIFRGGVEHSIRDVTWKYLLNYYQWDMSETELRSLKNKKTTEYYLMKSQWKSITPLQESRFTDFHERKSLIKKDVDRTDRTYEFYAGDQNPNLTTLYDILMTYVMYNFDLGYVQGMSDLLSPILFVLRDEVDAFWCFVGFMDRVSTNFDIDQAGMKLQLQQLFDLVNFVCPKLATYLKEQGSANMYFCFRWLLVLFKREFSQNDTMRLWEVLWTDKPCKNFHLLISVAILDTEKTVFEEKGYGFAKILKHVNDLSMHINLEYTLSKAEAIYHQIVSSPHLTNNIRRILGLKEVISEDTPAIDDAAFSKKVSLGNHSEATTSTGGNSNGISMYADKEEVSYQRSIETNFL